jgi:EF hand
MRSFFQPNRENDTMNHATAKIRTASLIALSITLALAATATVAQDAAPQPVPAADDKASPAKTAWEDLDINKDGNLSKEETVAMPALHDVFEKADSNADGALTGDEYRGYLAANQTDQGKPKQDKK